METETLKESKRYFSKLGFQLVLIAFAMIAVQLLSSIAVSAIAPGLSENYSLYFLANMLPLYILGIPAILLLTKSKTVSPAEEHRMSIGQWLIAFCISYSLMYVSNMIGLWITQIIGRIKGSAVENVIQEVALDLNPWAAMLCMVILAPIFEELVFRKFIIDRTAKYGEGTAILVSALSFALFHGNLNQFAYAFSLGLFWGFIYIKTRKIKYTICIHMVINFMGSVLSILLMRSGFIQELSTLSNPDDMNSVLTLISEHAAGIILYLVYLLLIFIFVITGIVFFFLNRKKMHLSAGEVVIPKGQRFRTVILNVGMILNIIFWGVQIITQLFH